MDVVSAIGMNLSLHDKEPTNIMTEHVEKGPSDRPKVDVVISDAGELEIEYETDEEGNQVPLHAEL